MSTTEAKPPTKCTELPRRAGRQAWWPEESPKAGSSVLPLGQPEAAAPASHRGPTSPPTSPKHYVTMQT